MASAGGGVGGRFFFRPGGGVGGRFALRPGGGVGGRAAGAEAMLSSSSKSNSICLYVSRYSAVVAVRAACVQLVSHTAASYCFFASGRGRALHRRWMTAIMICRPVLSSVDAVDAVDRVEPGCLLASYTAS